MTTGLLERQIHHERVARRAYQLYEGRGREDGHAEEDWSRAVSEEAARTHDAASAPGHYGASRAFGERVRGARL
jgi:hypothetical protein